MGNADSKPSEGGASHGQQSSCPVPHQNRSAALNQAQSCPSSKNQMPTDLAQKPLPGQTVPLETNRVVSSIPMADESGESKNWVYPSEQMFFDAMRRKNWNPDEVDMKTVVPIHNAVNERAWSQILEWEKDTDSSKYFSIGAGVIVDVADRD
jgi:cytochrome c heme-lyase